MKSVVIPDAETRDDARLVELGRGGNREAFGALVARYQSPLCAMAYSACGNIAQSEDLAQEAFIIAWRKLGDLQEPGKFKSWLYGIARNLILTAFRQQSRNPLAAAEPLDEALLVMATVPNPAGHAMNREEQEILWRSLEQIPETYREPLVLFYREHESIERVAEVMELSEEAARQRLSRGRKLLQEQVQSFVEGALRQSGPGPAFTASVIASLPAAAISAKTLTLGTAIKGGAAVKGAGLMGMGFALIAPLFAFWGMWMDYRARKKAQQPAALLRLLKYYYLGILVSVVVMVALITLLMSYGGEIIRYNAWLFATLITGSIGGYFIVIAIGRRWFCRRVKELYAKAGMPVPDPRSKPTSPVWEYRSRFELFGLPFIHIRTGGWRGTNPARDWKPVKAWIAADDGAAYGVLFAYGAGAVAPVSMGAFSIGLISFGAMSIGILSIGGFGFGIWAFGPFAFGRDAYGSCAIALNAAWGWQYAVGHHWALSNMAAPQYQPHADAIRQHLRAMPFFRISEKYSRYLGLSLWVWMVPLMISMVFQWLAGARKRKEQAAQTI
jgi:RNA polymerase sigma factor (sigma-70 family)